MKRMHHLIKSLALIGLLFAALGAQATILTIPDVTAAGGSTATVFLVEDDDYFITKDYDVVESIDFTATVATGGPKLVTFNEYIVNDTGTVWTNFRIEIELLGGIIPGGGGAAVLGPVVVNTTNALFDTANVTVFTEFVGLSGLFTLVDPNPFLTLVNVPGTLDFSGGILNPGEFFALSYSFLVPALDVAAELRITQTPNVPEPASLALLGLGLAGLGFSRRKKMA